MTNDPVNKALPVLFAGGLTMLAAGTVYYLAQTRARPKTTGLAGALQGGTGTLSGTLPGLPGAAGALPSAPPRGGGQPRLGRRREREDGRISLVGITGVRVQQGLVLTNVNEQARGVGLQAGDIVRGVGGQPVVAVAQLGQIRRGVEIEIERNGRVVRVPAGASVLGGGLQPGAGQRPNARQKRNIDAQGLDGQLTQQGIWVNNVDGRARRLGLLPGDLVRTVDGRRLRLQNDPTFLLRSLNPAVGVLGVVRNGALIYLPSNTAIARGLPTVGTGPTPQQMQQAWLGAPAAQPAGQMQPNNIAQMSALGVPTAQVNPGVSVAGVGTWPALPRVGGR